MPYVTEYVYYPAPQPLKQRGFNWLLACLVIAAIVAIALPFWPHLTYNVQTSLPTHGLAVAQAHAVAEARQSPGPGNWLLIPSIGVKTSIVEGKDVGVLDREEGIWHQTGEVETGNFVIAGHRFKYLPPNTTTFYHLDKLEVGDNIVMWSDGERHAYRVERSFTVDRNATEILNPTSRTQLTLYTCTDLNASRRLVVIATPTN